MKTGKNKWILAVLLLTVCIVFAGCADAVQDGAGLLKEGKYTEAAESFQKAVNEGKNLGEAYRGLGICYWEQEDYEKASEAFQNALDNDAEKTATVYNMLGICELKLESYKKAAFYFQNGQMKEGAGEELMQEMAFNEIVAYEAGGDYVKALQELETYVVKYPEDEKAAKELEFLKTQVPKE